MANGIDDMSASEHSSTLSDPSRRTTLPAPPKIAIVMYWLTALLIFVSVAGSLYMQTLVALVAGHIGAVIKRRLIDACRAESAIPGLIKNPTPNRLRRRRVAILRAGSAIRCPHAVRRGVNEMKAKKLSVSKLKFVTTLMAVASLGLYLTGCAGTLNNQSATESDTLINWKESMQTMPIEVHGGFASHDAAETARSIPNGTTPDLYPGQNHSGADLASMPRIVLYVGMSQIPTDNTYCNKTPALRSIAVNHGEIGVTAALCDGTRLVVQARRDITPEHLASQGDAAVVNAIKSRLMLALSTNPSAPPVYN
jgi:hypothetical protein